MLEVSALSVAYGKHQALRDVSIVAAPGEIVAILGSNGAGKSSLLKALAGLVPKSRETSVTLGGKDISRLRPHEIVEAGLALVPEGRGLFGDLSVAENLQLGAFAKRARQGEADRLARVLDMFPRLKERRAQMARTMSGGEQQMLAIGRALMSSPDFVLLDEPSLGLAPVVTQSLFSILGDIAAAGTGIILVEQNTRASLRIAQHAYLLENGRIVGQGTAAELSADPAVQRAYLGL
ncbi:ABC transporter ATP-binding protein [Aquamicrobium sp. LC103]|uniref:ABC transporter ATP-binding protein n=1 Tax=Aquamicrobium sp. LC103 TaxID=1120658 RepID=UPI00063E8CF7|nr:ABC transporter ATP-binding protein [Aquamicrobium sp. LC103]TKT77441.1 ABC transporter ATP-binding protein [Aquamicrobium sp. LC103]